MPFRFQNLPTLPLVILACLGGLIAGYSANEFRRSADRSTKERAEPVDENSDDHEHVEHFDVSIPAAKNLGLIVRPVTLGDYQKPLLIPATVIEKPGQSGLSVTAPAQGVVREIFRFPGQALSPGDRLFTIQLTDEALESAQLSILETLTRISVVEKELARMEPLTESGAVLGRRKLEMEYELKQLTSERSARLQELRLRGLSAAQVDRVLETRELVGQIDVSLEVLLPTDDGFRQELIYTMEHLNVFPGRSVQKGEELCHVANHHELFLRGEAFETDLKAIHGVVESRRPIRSEFGDVMSSKLPHHVVDGLAVTYIDNHVDPATQTFPFYLALPNQVVSETRDAMGRVFRSWRFKPGQRAHLVLPIDSWSESIVIPRDAVVRSGIEHYAFRLINLDELESPNQVRSLPIEDLQNELEKLPDWEFQPVSVRILYQDRRNVVIDPSGDLAPGDFVAMNQAYQLLLAWKMESSGGGGHHHDH
ncbi:efflux RND transporter periplasmic adaptor subunit [Pirellulaceae bacterium SH449]